MASKSRPEYQAPPEIFYDDTEAKKYTRNSRMMRVQEELTKRALEILMLPAGQSSLILDVGCGSGLSGRTLTDCGHIWIGCDISRSMLKVARHTADDEGSVDVIEKDMGQGLGFRSGVFDGAVSISALQWLCYSTKRSHVPFKRLTAFFQSLYNSMRRGARACLQFYPESPRQMEMITAAALRCGFTGGVLVDFPNSTKAKKHFLVIDAGKDSMSYLAQPTPKTEADRLGAGGGRNGVQVRLGIPPLPLLLPFLDPALSIITAPMISPTLLLLHMSRCTGPKGRKEEVTMVEEDIVRQSRAVTGSWPRKTERGGKENLSSVIANTAEGSGKIDFKAGSNV